MSTGWGVVVVFALGMIFQAVRQVSIHLRNIRELLERQERIANNLWAREMAQKTMAGWKARR